MQLCCYLTTRARAGPQQSAKTHVVVDSLRFKRLTRFRLFTMLMFRPPALRCVHAAPREGILTELLIPTGGEVVTVSTSSSMAPSRQAENSSKMDTTSTGSQDTIPTQEDSATMTTQDTATLSSMESSSDSLSSCSQEVQPLLHTPSQVRSQDSDASAQRTDKQSSLPSPLDYRTSRQGEPKPAKPTSPIVIGRLSFCGHPELHGTLCTSCGRSVLNAQSAEEPGARSGGCGGAGGRAAVGGRSGGFVDGLGERKHMEREGGMSKVTMKGGGTLTLSSTGTCARVEHVLARVAFSAGGGGGRGTSVGPTDHASHCDAFKGDVLPVREWRCDDCGYLRCIGGVRVLYLFCVQRWCCVFVCVCNSSWRA